MPTKSNNIGSQGGVSPGAGRKKTAAIGKIADENKSVRILDIPDVEGAEMPNSSIVFWYGNAATFSRRSV